MILRDAVEQGLIAMKHSCYKVVFINDGMMWNWFDRGLRLSMANFGTLEAMGRLLKVSVKTGLSLNRV